MEVYEFEGKTKEEALAKAEEKLGSDYTILSDRTVSAKGFFGLFKKPTFKVTVGREDDLVNRTVLPTASVKMEKENNHRFSAVVNEEATPRTAAMQMPPSQTPLSQASSVQASPQGERQPSLSQEDLRSVFRDVGELFANTESARTNARNTTEPIPNVGNTPVANGSTYDRNATIIKYNDPVRSTEYTREKGMEQPGRVSEVIPQPVVPGSKPADTINTAAKDADDDANALKNKQGVNYGLIKKIYNVLRDNEVDERYVNDIINEIDSAIIPGADITSLLSKVYQKMLFKLGHPRTIEIGAKRPKVVLFIGPTGVGKTTTLAKLAAYFKLNCRNSVAMLTTDSYRIKAVDQLEAYAKIIGAPLKELMVKDNENNINDAISEYKNNDLILVDTFGFSYRNEEHREEIRLLLDQIDRNKYDVSTYLVLSATTKYKDLMAIVDAYKELTDFDIIFTKLDETYAYGNIFNIRLYSEKSLSYVTNGQEVAAPGDLEVMDSQKLVRQLLGGQ